MKCSILQNSESQSFCFKRKCVLKNNSKLCMSLCSFAPGPYSWSMPFEIFTVFIYILFSNHFIDANSYDRKFWQIVMILTMLFPNSSHRRFQFLNMVTFLYIIPSVHYSFHFLQRYRTWLNSILQKTTQVSKWSLQQWRTCCKFSRKSIQINMKSASQGCSSYPMPLMSTQNVISLTLIKDDEHSMDHVHLGWTNKNNHVKLPMENSTSLRSNNQNSQGCRFSFIACVNVT